MAITATDNLYLENRRRICSCVNRFAQVKGGDRDELLSEANEHFITACRTYEDDHGADVGTWIYYRIWHGLQSTRRTEDRRNSHRNGALDVDDAPRNERGLFIDDLLANVSDDAATLVRLVLRTRKRTGQRPAEVKKHSIRTLLGLGWSGPRIAAAFNEVKEFIR